MNDSQRRKERSNAILSDLGVQVNNGLPTIESASETSIRAAEEVARRVLCLILISEIAMGASVDGCKKYLRDNGLYSCLSPVERKYFDGENNLEKTSINLTWRREAAYLLLWSLGLAKELPAPWEETPSKNIYSLLQTFAESANDWVKNVKLIDKESILDQADLIYRMHWSTRQASLDGKSMKVLNAGVVQERHYAINWLTCYQGEDWDDVSTDT